MLDKLSSSLKSTLSKIAQAMFVDEKLIDELVKGIQRSLLQADVNVQLVFELSKKIKDRTLKEKPPSGVSQKEYIIKVIDFLPEDASDVNKIFTEVSLDENEIKQITEIVKKHK